MNVTAPDDTVWHHYAVVTDGSSLNIWVDGVIGAGGETGVSTGFILDTIGAAYTTARDFDFHGQIDEFWLLDEALDATTIGYLYTTNTLDGVPEPATMSLLALGGMAMLRRRKQA